MSLQAWPLSQLLLALVIGLLCVFFLHWLRIRPHVHRVPTLLFWRIALASSRERTLFRRFRHPLAFVLSALLVASLLVALADPRTSPAIGRTRVFILDTSPSMALGADGAPSRLDLARQEIRALLGQTGLSDDTALIVALPFGARVVGFEESRAELEASLAAAAVSSGDSDLRSAFFLAAAMKGSRPDVSIVVFTDRDAVPPPEAKVESSVAVRRQGGGGGDAAIVGVFDHGMIRVRVAAYGETSPRRILLLDPASKTSVSSLEIATIPDGITDYMVSRPALCPQVLSVRLEPEDRAPMNDVGRVVLDDGLSSVPVAFAGGAATAFGSLLNSDPRIRALWAEEPGILNVRSVDSPGGSLVPGPVEVAVSSEFGSLEPWIFVAESLPAFDVEGASGARDVALVRDVRGGLPRSLARFHEETRTLEVPTGLLDGELLRRQPLVSSLALLLCRRLAGIPAKTVVVDSRLRLDFDPSPIMNSSGLLLGPQPVLWSPTNVARLEGRFGTREIAISPPLPRAPATVPSDPVPDSARPKLSPWEWLAILALLLVALDSWFVVRGRIP